MISFMPHPIAMRSSTLYQGVAGLSRPLAEELPPTASQQQQPGQEQPPSTEQVLVQVRPCVSRLLLSSSLGRQPKSSHSGPSLLDLDLGQDDADANSSLESSSDESSSSSSSSASQVVVVALCAVG